MFRVKQYLKMLLQNILLPLVYACFCQRPVRKGSVIFADGHHEEMPFSMRRMYETVTGKREASGGADGLACPGVPGEADDAHGSGRKGESFRENEDGDWQVEVFVRDFGKMSFGEMVRFLLRFMKSYATAEYVFICDYFLPAASCRKRPETTLVQLWHSCGLMKKIAFDAGDDIPKNYRGNMFGNYSWLTMSAQACVPVHHRALRLPQERIRATGISRTDYYFDEEWKERCRRAFYAQYPQAQGRKIALWAPTFRGNAANPWLEGLEDIRRAAADLRQDESGNPAGEDSWYLIIKAHPHVDAHGMVSNCGIPTEELLPVADVLITDYSSVMFDYLIFGKPLLLFAPDLAEYDARRGFYLDYRSMPFSIVEDGRLLAEAIQGCEADSERRADEIRAFREKYTGACDGRATERILRLIGMRKS